MNKLPFPIEFDLSPFRWVMAFIPHPDDEALGCGGLLHKLACAGCAIDLVLVSDGSGGPDHPENLSSKRLQEFRKSLAVLQVHQHTEWNLPDGRLADVKDLGRRIDNRITNGGPDLVIAPWPHDLHADHAVIGQHVAAACARQGVTVAYFEVWSPLPATHVLDVTDVFRVKKKALRQHRTALRFGNYLGAMTGLATFRGIYLPYLGKPRFAEAYLVRTAGSSQEARLNACAIDPASAVML